MKNLKGVIVGDKIWSVLKGKGKISRIVEGDICLLVIFDNYDQNTEYGYTAEGCTSQSEYPTLFFDMPNFYKKKEYPKKQK